MKRILISTAVTIGALAAFSGTGLAQSSNLGSTSWKSTNYECNIGYIEFRSDGTADVQEPMNGEKNTAHWTLEGTALHIKYDSWYGGIQGVFDGGNRIQATETWQSETNEINNDPCIFEKD